MTEKRSSKKVAKWEKKYADSKKRVIAINNKTKKEKKQIQRKKKKATQKRKKVDQPTRDAQAKILGIDICFEKNV